MSRAIEALPFTGYLTQVLLTTADKKGMIRKLFDLFILFCIAFAVLFGIVFRDMFAHFIFG